LFLVESTAGEGDPIVPASAGFLIHLDDKRTPGP